MFSDTVDNFFVVTSSAPNSLFPHNSQNDFSVSFPYKKDFSLNETWEVAVTSLTVPNWSTCPRGGGVKTKFILLKSEVELSSSTVTKSFYVDCGYFRSKCDYIKSLKLLYPIFVYRNRQDGLLRIVDFDEYFTWHLLPVTDTFILDTSAFFRDYPDGFLEIRFGSTVHKTLQTARSKNQFTKDYPPDHRIRTGTTDSENARDGQYFRHAVQLRVYSNLTSAVNNQEGTIFHSSEINDAKNHTPFGAVNLVPNRLEYHKVTTNHFQYMNFRIQNLAGEEFTWLSDSDIKIGLHFRRRYLQVVNQD